MTSVKSRPSTAPVADGPSEFEILKANHRFLRDDEDPSKGKPSSWNEELARKFYSNLWREYALCDLKHYKSGNFALRWRTEDEVVAGAGETSCGNTRCKNHNLPEENKYGGRASASKSKRRTALHTLELPFGYSERGEAKSALVKVVLCDKCVRKIMWKREQDKASTRASEGDSKSPSSWDDTAKTKSIPHTNVSSHIQDPKDQGSNFAPDEQEDRRRRSRSLSPSRDTDLRHKRR